MAPDISEHIRCKAWGALTASLPDRILENTKGVEKGNCEELLRRVRRIYYHPGSTTVDSLLTQVSELQLLACNDIHTYLAKIRRCVDLLAQQGERPSNAMLLFYLKKGLTEDYDTIKRELEKLSPAPTLEVATNAVIDFASSRPGITGGLSRKDQAHSASEACQVFTRTGKCPRGVHCKFAHIRPPHHSRPVQPRTHHQPPPRHGQPSNQSSGSRCTYCNALGHTEAQCNKKKAGITVRCGNCRIIGHKTADCRKQPKAQDAGHPAIEIKDDIQPDEVVFATDTGRQRHSAKQRNPVKFLLDSGASVHVMTDASLLTNLRSCSISISVGGGTHHCTLLGDFHGVSSTGRRICLKDVRICPDFGINVLSEAKLLASGCIVQKDSNNVSITLNGETLAHALPASNALFYIVLCPWVDSSHRPVDSHAKSDLDFRVSPPVFLSIDDPDLACSSCGQPDQVYIARAFSPNTSELLLWHQRCGHRNFYDIARLRGLRLPSRQPFCKACIEGKSEANPLSKRRATPLHPAPRSAYALHTDYAGPFRVNTRSGARYMCIFVDGFSKYIHVYLHKSTTKFLEALKELVLRIETEKGKKEVVAQLIADSAAYFEKSAPVQLFCSQKGIVQLYSPPYTQSLNGLAERTIRTVIEMARTMLMHSSVPSHFYGDAITTKTGQSTGC